MRYLGKSKISKLHPQPNTIYPLIRLPQQCADVIGVTAHIFQTEHEGEKAFLILLNNRETAKRKIIKEFIKSKPEIELKSHLITLESKIDEVYALLFKNRDLKSSQITKKQWARGDSNARPPPCEGDVITT
jgi:hypothetical protein